MPPARRRGILRAIGVVALLAAAVALGWILARPPEAPAFDQLTFRRARIGAARFVADGRAVVYSEAREGNALEVWRLDLEEQSLPRRLDFPPGTEILAARGGELALSVKRRFLRGERFVGTLAVAGGSAPRELAENIEDADWDRDGRALAVVRSTGGMGGRSWLEYPIGTKRHETTGSIRFLRISRDGRRVAFIEDTVGSGEGGHVVVLELDGAGSATKMTEVWKSARGLAWSPDGSEVWFAAGDSRANRALRAVRSPDTQRVVMSAPGSLTLWDVASDGRVLLTRDEERRSLIGVSPGQDVERELSWFDDSGLADVSDDGKQVLFSDRFGVYLRDTTGGLPTRLGLNDAYADDLSPDGKQVLATNRAGDELQIYPSVGPPRPLPRHRIVSYNGARWFPGGQRVMFSGWEQKGDLRSYVQDVNGGEPKPITPEHIWALAISPDGRTVAAIGDAQPGVSLWPVDGAGPSRLLAGSEQGDRPVAFSPDGQSLWLFRRGEVPAQVIQLDINTGQRQVAKTLMPSDLAGVYSITEFAITPAGDAYFYSYRRSLSQLYLVRGLR